MLIVLIYVTTGTLVLYLHRTKNSRNMLFHVWVFIFSSEKIDCLESATNYEVDFFHKCTIDVCCCTFPLTPIETIQNTYIFEC